jgi:hypothetical protein
MRVFQHGPWKGRDCYAQRRLIFAGNHLVDAYPPAETLAVVALNHAGGITCLGPILESSPTLVSLMEVACGGRTASAEVPGSLLAQYPTLAPCRCGPRRSAPTTLREALPRLGPSWVSGGG